MAPRLFIISGSAGSGKSLLLKTIQSQSIFPAATAPKYSTRPERVNEFDDTKHVNQINDEEYTFVYPLQTHVYGIKAEEITALLAQGYNVFVALSDLRVVEEVKRYFGSLAVSLYIYRNLSSRQLRQILDEREKRRNPAEPKPITFTKEGKSRINRLYLMQRQYVENITLFDHAILNTGEPEDLLDQVRNIIVGYDAGLIRRGMKGPVIFLIAAASGSGKRTLMSAMYNFGRRSIYVIEKATTRLLHPDDGQEIYHVDKIDGTTFDINYVFHETEYGIETEKIWQNLARGRPQILITNMQQFEKFRERFGPLTVCVYLHATRTKKQLYEWQLKRHGDAEKASLKVAELRRIHQDYIENIAHFQHVLLNTIEVEDFWEQMFRLVRFYSVPA